jgi:spermidine synthase
MNVELLRDASRENGWWLLVGGSEQSYVDTDDPLHLEFEYVQFAAHILDSMFVDDTPLRVLHLGGGLCTLPRWVAARHPGSRQRVAERSAEIAGLAASLGMPPGVTVMIHDALAVTRQARPASLDVVISDVYDGPETVTRMFTVEAQRTVRRVLKPEGVFVANLSDASPFGLSRAVAATVREVFGSVAMLSEPPVLRGRRSGNLVLAATDGEIPLAELGRRAAGGLTRARLIAGEDLTEFVGDAAVAIDEAELPVAGD